MIRQIGDISWEQLSIWDFAPDNCVESYIKDNGQVFHYKLVRVREIISSSHWKIENVLSVEGISEDILFSRDREVFIKNDGKRTQILKEK